MNICLNNRIKEIKNIVQKKAKYQKVMLLFDDFVSSFCVKEVYETIKDICVYNQSNLKNFDKNELFNGYKAIIYLCETNSFLKCSFNRGEFVNIFCPQDEAILPYFLSVENQVDDGENYLIVGDSKIDIMSISSVNFNLFFNYFKSLLNGYSQFASLGYANQEISQFNLLDCVKSLPKDTFFVDIDILKKCELDYRDLVFVDLLLVDAFLVFISSAKTETLTLVDVYKSAKDECEAIDKFYKLYNNQMFKNIIQLNYNCLFNFCLKMKKKILEIANFFTYDKNYILSLIEKIKQYAKNDNDLIAYLYLYNIFSV